MQLELTGHIEAARAERKESKEEEDAHGETTVSSLCTCGVLAHAGVITLVE